MKNLLIFINVFLVIFQGCDNSGITTDNCDLGNTKCENDKTYLLESSPNSLFYHCINYLPPYDSFHLKIIRNNETYHSLVFCGNDSLPFVDFCKFIVITGITREGGAFRIDTAMLQSECPGYYFKIIFKPVNGSTIEQLQTFIYKVPVLPDSLIIHYRMETYNGDGLLIPEGTYEGTINEY
jgi:hypothetical protein